MIEIGTSTHAIAGFGPPGKPFRQALEEMAACGFQHFLLLCSEAGPPVSESGEAPGALVDLLHSDPGAVAAAAARHGLRVSCVYPGFPLDYSPAGMESTVARLRAYRDLAWRLGCHTMVHSAGAAPAPRTPLRDKTAQIDRVAEVMDAVAGDEPGGIFRMAVDLHYGGLVETVADAEYLLERARRRNAGLCLNMGHMTTLGEPGWTLLERHPERVHVLAWKDHLIGPNLPEPVVSVELGKGATPFERYAQVYASVSCDALHLITFEHVPFEEKQAALRRSRERLQRLLEGVAS